MEQLREVEHPGHAQQDVAGEHHVDHEVAHRLATDDTEDAVVVAADGHEVAVAVVLSCRTGREPDAQQECLLEDQNEHARQ